MRDRRISGLAGALPLQRLLAAKEGELIPAPQADSEPPLFREPWVPVIPIELLTGLRETLKPARRRRGKFVFQPDDLLREEIAAERAKESFDAVGFRGGYIVNCESLKPVASQYQLTDGERQEIADIAEEAGTTARPALAKRAMLTSRVALCNQGYCGWLMTQRAFHDEHQQLRSQLKAFPLGGGRFLAAQYYVLAHQHVNDVPKHEDALRLIREFLTRWELASMPAPFVFEIEGPLINFPVSMVQQMRPNALVSVFPKNAKLPDRTHLRRILDRGPEGASDVHLAEWLDLVANDKQSDRTIVRYGDLYRVQHYYRSLRDRYPAIGRGCKRAAIEAIVAYVRGIQPRDVTKGVLDSFVKAVNRIDRLIAETRSNTLQDRQA